MKDKIKSFLKLSEEDVLMIVLAFMSFSFGVWINYRQLWLQDIGFSVTGISKILSVALICSAIISFIISFFSTKVKTKNIVMMSIVFRALAMTGLLFYMDNQYMIKMFMLLCIMCETIFSIAYYPLITTVNKSEETYRKQALISYLGKDAGVIVCGLLFGVVVGNIVFDLSACLFVGLISGIMGAIILLLFEPTTVKKKRNILPIKKAIKNLFKSKITNYYLFTQFVVEISYGLVFGMMMLILTEYVKFSVGFSSVFIILCNVLGSIACSIFVKYGKNLTVKQSVLIKYGIRVILYGLAFLTGNIYVIILSIMVGYITARILDDKVNGTYIRKIETNSQFLFGNIRYFVISLGDGIGILIAGYLLQLSFRYLFLGVTFFTIMQILLHLDLITKKER